jgi:protein-S-isoprenylcysteine O-methyltransferase Ste14
VAADRPRSDDARWTDAESLLGAAPAESVRRRVRRSRWSQLLLVVGISGVVGAVVGVVVVLLASGSEPADVPVWLAVVGFAVATGGLVLAGVAVVRQWRAVRRRGAWRSPLWALTPRQRKQLLAQVRGTAPVDQARLPLARELAAGLLEQRHIVPLTTGLLALWVGLLVASPAWWRVPAAVVLAVCAAFAVPAIRRDERRARAFLAAHPPEPTPADHPER